MLVKHVMVLPNQYNLFIGVKKQKGLMDHWTDGQIKYYYQICYAHYNLILQDNEEK